MEFWFVCNYWLNFDLFVIIDWNNKILYLLLFFVLLIIYYKCVENWFEKDFLLVLEFVGICLILFGKYNLRFFFECLVFCKNVDVFLLFFDVLVFIVFSFNFLCLFCRIFGLIWLWVLILLRLFDVVFCFSFIFDLICFLVIFLYVFL